MRTRRTGPSTSGGGGGAGPTAPPASRCRSADDNFVADRPQHRLKLIDGEELQIRVRVPLPTAARPCGATHRVLAHPAAIDRVLENRVQEAQDVTNRLRGQAVGKHRARQGLDVSRGDVGDRQRPETGRDVYALHRLTPS